MEKLKKASRIVVEEIPSEKKEDITKPVIPETPKEQPVLTAPSSTNYLWIIIPGMILLGLLIGGIIAYYTGIQKLSSNNNSSLIKSTPPPETTPSPTPIATPNLSNYKIKILNGSGIKGEAGKVEELLEKADFTVESTGNAKTYDYTQTIIQAKSSVEEGFLTKLKSSLSKTYEVGKNETLKDSETSPVIILVGSLKAK